MKTKLYMAVTPDKYELPMCVTPNVDELAEKYNVSRRNILCKISKNAKGTRSGFKFVRVVIDE